MAHVVKVVKGEFFGTPYWSGKMKLAAVARDILPPNDPFWDPIFDPIEGAQRELNRRRVADEMVPYLLNPNPKHPFFSAITVILVPIDGDELLEERDYKFDPAGGPGSDIGTLTIQDQVSLFPADGQHRREAIAQAFAERRGIHSEEIPVIFVPFKGQDRVRQLFADLNLHAKPASKTLGLSYELRDSVVIVVKRVMQLVTLFDSGKRVNMKTNSLAAKSQAVISMNTLVEATTHILAALLNTPVKQVREHPDLKAIESLEPRDHGVNDLARRVADVWNVIIDAIPAWADVREGRRTAGQIRDGVKNDAGQIEEEGYVFAFGLGWQALALVAAAIIRVEDDDWSEAIQRAITSVNWQKAKHWNGIAMVFVDPEFKIGRVNNTGPGVRSTAGYVLKTAEYGDVEDGDVQGLIAAYEGPRESTPAAA